jgi:hypothetical protein
VLKIVSKGSYKSLVSPVTQRDWENAHLTIVATDANRDDQPFDYPPIADKLDKGGHRVSDRGVWRF